VGCSVGDNLFNPGEPDIVAIRAATGVDIGHIINMTVIPNLISLSVSIAVLTWLVYRTRAAAVLTDADVDDAPMTRREFVRALLPPLPVLLLLLLQPGLGLFPGLNALYPQGVHVSAVMVVCAGLVMLVTLSEPQESVRHLTRLTKEFFSGMGYAFTHVISLIIAAACFLAGLDALGAIAKITKALASDSSLAAIISPILTWGLAVVSGSGTAPSVAFSQAVLPGIAGTVGMASAVLLGIVGAIGASLGRTMSPVSAIMLFTSTLAEVDPKDLVRLVAIPMGASLLATIVYGLVAS
jgi:DcuC family C4-dicarboxylate transporter